jgi:citrate synthase
VAEHGMNASTYAARVVASTGSDLVSSIVAGLGALAVVLEAVGLPREAFTATFAVGCVAGWCAHVAEQRRVGKLIRPSARYVGPPAL